MNTTCSSFEITTAEPLDGLGSLFATIQEQRPLLMASVALGVLSSVVALLTYLAIFLSNWVCAHLYTVVDVRQHDQLYHWILEWLAAQREVHEHGTRIFAEHTPKKGSTAEEGAAVRFLPIDDGSMYRFRFEGALLWISHVSAEAPSIKCSKRGLNFTASELRLRITVLGRSKQAANALFQAAYKHNKDRLDGRTEIFVAQPHEQAEHSHWRRLQPRQNRPLHTVVASSDPAPDTILKDMQAFFDSEAWYADRGVPYRRGYLFHGPPGCGKTSFMTAAAGALGCPIYILNLAEPTLSDLGLLKLVTDAPPRSMLLMEDVDAAFHGAAADDNANQPPAGGDQRVGSHIGLLTFSGLLNALDGVAGQEGKLCVMSTNHPENLDEALVRPGRVDLRVKFHRASCKAIKQVFCNFFAGGTLTVDQLRDVAGVFANKCSEEAVSMATIQGHLMQFRDDPLAAAEATPPSPNKERNAPRIKQFSAPVVNPRGSVQEEE